MVIQQHIENWKWAVAGKPRGTWPETITTDDLTTYRQWCGLLNKATMQANSKGFAAKAGGADKGKSGGKSMWINSGGHILKIAYVPRPRQQAVTETSIAAFHALERTSLQGRIAEMIACFSVGGGDATRREIAAAMGLETATVSARVNELLHMPGFYLNGQRCRIVITGERASILPHATIKCLMPRSGVAPKSQALRLELWREEKPVQAALF